MKSEQSGHDAAEGKAKKKPAGVSHEAKEAAHDFAAGRPEEAFERISDVSRNIREDATALAQTLNTAADEVQQFVQSQLEQRPYATLGVAAGAGFILGGGLSVKLGSVLFGIGGRLLANVLLREVLRPAT